MSDIPNLDLILLHELVDGWWRGGEGLLVRGGVDYGGGGQGGRLGHLAVADGRLQGRACAI